MRRNPQASPEGDRLHLHFAQAAREGKDIRIIMIRNAAGTWRGTLPAMAPGTWYLELGNEQWRLAAPVWMPAFRRGFVLYASDTEASQVNSSC